MGGLWALPHPAAVPLPGSAALPWDGRGLAPGDTHLGGGAAPEKGAVPVLPLVGLPQDPSPPQKSSPTALSAAGPLRSAGGYLSPVSLHRSALSLPPPCAGEPRLTDAIPRSSLSALFRDASLSLALAGAQL